MKERVFSLETIYIEYASLHSAGIGVADTIPVDITARVVAQDRPGKCVVETPLTPGEIEILKQLKTAIEARVGKEYGGITS